MHVTQSNFSLIDDIVTGQQGRQEESNGSDDEVLYGVMRCMMSHGVNNNQNSFYI